MNILRQRKLGQAIKVSQKKIAVIWNLQGMMQQNGFNTLTGAASAV